MTNDQIEDTKFHLKSKVNEDVLELSSTGYGLESVSKKTVEKQNVQEPEKTNFGQGVDDYNI